MSLTTIAEQPVKQLMQADHKLGELEVLIGREALALFDDKNFILEWNSLYDACPWATIFQTYDFVACWYKHYASQHNPILVLSRYNGRLIGILPMAEGIDELGIAGAGGHSAYYHMWLSAPEHGETFIEAALQTLLLRFPGQDICLKYIPHNVPMGWLPKNKNWGKHCVLRSFSRPLMNLRKHVSDEVLNKRRFKEKYNRLKRLGKVEFEFITDYVTFEAILDQLADQYDFRKAATLNLMPFREDPAKRPFLLDLFQRGVLVAAVLKVNGVIISGITATAAKDGWSHGAGINTHNPAYSRYSPGYVILKLLSIALKDTGVDTYDLTPGGHTYKDYHADEHDSLIELRVTNALKALYLQRFYKAKAMLKAAMEKKGVDARKFRKTLSNQLVIFKEKLMLLKISLANRSSRIYATGTIVTAIPVEHTSTNKLDIQENSLGDILLYDPNGTAVLRWEFMKNAMMHLEAGFIPYSYCKDNRLLCLVWQTPQLTKTDKVDIQQAVDNLPESSVVLCNMYCHSAGTDCWSEFIKEVAQKISSTYLNKSIYFLENVDFLTHNSREV